MGFTTPCFIRKNTPELRKKLEKLGYKSRTISNNDKLCLATTANNVYAKYTIITNEMFDSVDPHRTWNCAGRIDCGTNEELFLAIAALRDDTNENQWFICDVNHWDRSDNGEATVYAEIGEWIFCKSNDDDCARDNHYHKATVEELIEHFNKS
jgi:hypothetical protein